MTNKTERNAARTKAYALIFGPAKTAKKPKLEVDLQERKRDPLTIKGFKECGREIVKLFEVAAFGPRRERELIYWYNAHRPKNARPFRYVPETETFEESDENVVIDHTADIVSSIKVRQSTRNAMEAWGR